MAVERVVVVGGGASGVLTAAALSRRSEVGGIVLVAREDRVGPGLAYGTAAAHHRLNSPAGRMSAWQDDPDDFLRWAATAGSPQDAAEFSPRRLYGDYLESVAASLPRTTVVHGEAVDVRGGAVVLADGRSIPAYAVVLALGNPPPLGRTAPAVRAVADPWAPGALDGVRGRVLLLGTGLTMVDVATSLARADPGTRLTATSRNRLLPRVHLDVPQPAGPGVQGDPTTVGGVVRAFHDRLRACDRAWQAEVDGVRPQVNALWGALGHEDRVRFIRHVSRHWEVHRHRMSPIVAAEVHGLLASGRLVIGDADGEYDAVVDCTGPRPFAEPGWNPLVDALLASGAAHPDALGIGIDVDAEGRVQGASALFAVGPARRGSQWESTAIPEIRQHATEVAAAVGGPSS
ncbi:FAD/NAD(P)-binding protein [Amnibacterium kyonggiense]|uniref:Putative NAD(P)/FAD-binding protein YdhS n=1 Tax=Amnibacterium kyonggiense TaxID=595671 RepID=A0A4R7FGM2_9MICO|nr:FAD/NAD(P)-binding protein [Amnibacterium kyonggiense]TDS76130.1 putative NAD(P)/FAD-binding protein YdhS [Amnibacterium kyonggiense]